MLPSWTKALVHDQSLGSQTKLWLSAKADEVLVTDEISVVLMFLTSYHAQLLNKYV